MKRDEPEETYTEGHIVPFAGREFPVSDQKWASMTLLAQASTPPLLTMDYVIKLMEHSIKNPPEGGPGGLALSS